jgi:hypothetical protein
MIPNVIHFCFGLAPRPQFGFLEYLAVRSALEINRPERICFHYLHESRGPWWELAKRIVTASRVEPPTRIFGRPLWHYAHQCDVLRLLILQRHGGIYLDIDTLCVRPFTDLLHHACVLGRQPERGLCNAVILSEPEGAFVNAWLESYRTFRSAGHDAHWDEHSVIMPARLAARPELRGAIAIAEERAFFFPMWNDMGALFESGDETLFARSYCIHYWETLTRQCWLRRIEPRNAALGESNFARFVRRVLGNGRQSAADSRQSMPGPPAVNGERAEINRI